MSAAIQPTHSHTGVLPENVKHWVIAVPMLAGPKRNTENIMDALDSQGSSWVLQSTELHQDYLYLFLVHRPSIQAVEIIEPKTL